MHDRSPLPDPGAEGYPRTCCTPTSTMSAARVSADIQEVDLNFKALSFHHPPPGRRRGTVELTPACCLDRKVCVSLGFMHQGEKVHPSFGGNAVIFHQFTRPQSIFSPSWRTSAGLEVFTPPACVYRLISAQCETIGMVAGRLTLAPPRLFKRSSSRFHESGFRGETPTVTAPALWLRLVGGTLGSKRFSTGAFIYPTAPATPISFLADQ